MKPHDRAMEQYGALGRARVDAIAAAIVSSGGKVVRVAPPNVAPFEFDVVLPDKKRMHLICYAFTAEKYRQGGRPVDEHRFQVKYGSDFKRLHHLHVEQEGPATTLFFGVYESGDAFVAVDPALHNPTWFSSSVEFKEENVDEVRRTGWHGWSRARVARGRRRINQNESLVTETVHGFRPEHFLTYARFERLATGIDPGERLLLVRSIGADLRAGRVARDLVRSQVVPNAELEHELLQQFGLPIDEVLDLIAKAPRLRTAVRGGVAERHLHVLLQRAPGIDSVKKIDEDGEPDFSFTYDGRRFRLECKLVSPELSRGLPRVDFQKTRASKSDPCSRYYSSDQFDLLAACVHPVTGTWDYRYAWTASLPPHKKCGNKITDRILVESTWPGELGALLAGAS